ncbi:MAG: hypothetical protein JO328_10510 [Hyphomicrobiales bacterium]|nr:hypothetical protein [Hyphomicrobiales bacterium]MBV8825744.1 hypothetical protein [Hyphomicrobiales bacterium]MBV9428500.1 hypothetical protein [Bradyrhizobiaceae bacterium]
MSDEREGAGSGRPPSGRRRRPPPTIEGTASEIAREPVIDAVAESAATAEPAPNPESAPATEPAPETIAAAEESAREAPHPTPESEPAAGHHSEPPRQPPPPPPAARGDARPWIAAAIAGVLFLTIIGTALWLLSQYLNRDASLAGKVDALDTQVRGLAGKPAPADAKALDDLRTRVDTIDASLRRVDDRLNRAESALATPRSAPTDPAVLARLSAAESMQRALGDTLTDLRKRIEDNAAAARDARDRADAVGKSSGADANDALRKDNEALTARVAALEHAEHTTNQRVEQTMTGASADRVVRLAVVAGALRTAVERGAPFTAELAAAKALGADASALAPLEPFAAAGVPNADVLARDFDRAESAMSAAAAPPSQNGGILGRLQANAERLVRVHPVGDVPGDEPAAALARAGAKAHRGDIAGALAEVEKLPPAVQAPAADWIKAAKARTAAVDAARRLAANAVTGLGNTSP